jgi:hypothetical protein
VLFEKAIEVTGPRDRTLVMYNGVERQTYSCTPDCSRRLTLGELNSDNVVARPGR